MFKKHTQLVVGFTLCIKDACNNIDSHIYEPQKKKKRLHSRHKTTPNYASPPQESSL